MMPHRGAESTAFLATPAMRSGNTRHHRRIGEPMPASPASKTGNTSRAISVYKQWNGLIKIGR
jgi:hypothetical protein